MHIICDRVSYRYTSRFSREITALQELDVGIDTAHIVGICGSTGSGKSTFIRHLNGILRPTCGEIRIDGDNIHRSPEILRHVRQRIGMTFQFPERQFLGRTVWEELSYTLEHRCIPQPEIAHRIQCVAGLLDIDVTSLKHHSPFHLSRGMQRKIGIAVVLALQPELVVLDEPTAGLDRAASYHLLEALQQLHRQNRSQVMLVSHDLELLLKYVDSLIILSEGKVVFSGNPAEALHHSTCLDAYGLSLPPIPSLLHSLRASVPTISSQELTVDGALKEIIAHCPLTV